MRKRESLNWDEVIAILINLALWGFVIELVWQTGLKTGRWVA